MCRWANGLVGMDGLGDGVGWGLDGRVNDAAWLGGCVDEPKERCLGELMAG